LDAPKSASFIAPSRETKTFAPFTSLKGRRGGREERKEGRRKGGKKRGREGEGEGRSE
jgi:hypothetical protein